MATALTVPYDTAAGGQSDAANAAKMADIYQSQSSRAEANKNLQLGYSNDVFNIDTMPQLKSTIGAAGQYYSGARMKAVDTANRTHEYQNAGIESQFQNTMSDLQRQQVYASMGFIL